MKSIVSYPAIARLGNSMFQFAAAYAYALDHDLDFSPPSTTTNETWRALYFKHLIDPNIDSPSLKRVEVKESGYRYEPMEFRPEWTEDHLIVIDGYRQSEKYFTHHRERILEVFGFPWGLREGFCGVHLRRGDYLIHTNKHPAVPDRWYLDQIKKFPGYKFNFFSDDMDYVFKTFGDHPGFEQPLPLAELPDDRGEVRDLVALSQCEHVIGSASTFAVWAGMLGRNPGRRIIIPRQWICSGWSGTTAADWLDVCPTSPGWERA